MYTLAFDTSSQYGSVAVLEQTKVLAAYSQVMERGHDRWLPLAIQATLKEAKITFKDLSAVATTVGPGSYTGVRVSLAMAQGLRVSLGIPIMAVTAFDALRYHLRQVSSSSLILMLLDTKRHDAYAQWYEPQKEELSQITVVDTPLLRKVVEELTSYSQNKLHIVGTPPTPLIQVLKELETQHPFSFTYLAPTAQDIAKAAWQKPDSLKEVVPLYLRQPNTTSPTHLAKEKK